MAIFVILAIMANLVMAINMAIMGVFLKKSKNADQARKPFVNWSNGLKVIVKYLLHTHWYIIRMYYCLVKVLAGAYDFKHEVNISIL